MIDLNSLRENPERVQKAARNKNIDINVSHILEIDKKHKELSISVQKLREERNQLTDSLKGKPTKEQIEKGKILKEKLEKQDYALRAVAEELKLELYKIPNLPLNTVPVGDPSRFEVIKKVGEPSKFGFTPKDHLEIGEALDIIDVKRAAKVSGTRFAYLKNEGALLEFALINFALETLIKEGFVPVVPPVLIKKEITDGLGYWHGKLNEKYTANENYYLVLDSEEHKQGLYLVGTAEHVVAPMHKDDTFDKKDLPKKYVAFSSSFRREAGSYGKDTRGILRVHQFDKVEMVEFIKEEDDEKERKKMLSIVEGLLQKLELPYRVIRLASRDLAFPTAETIDVEIWMPSQNQYRETHSISTTTDFQSRRLNIKYQDGNEKKYVHILNGTAFAIGRTVIAIIENYQQKDGTILIPKALQKYLNNLKKISSKK